MDTLFALRSLDTLKTLSTLRALSSLDTLLALSTLRALDTLDALATLRTLSTLSTLDTLFALSTLDSLFPLSSLRTLYTLHTLLALRTLRALCPCASDTLDTLDADRSQNHNELVTICKISGTITTRTSCDHRKLDIIVGVKNRRIVDRPDLIIV